jgi:hypothetical protein
MDPQNEYSNLNADSIEQAEPTNATLIESLCPTEAMEMSDSVMPEQPLLNNASGTAECLPDQLLLE